MKKNLFRAAAAVGLSAALLSLAGCQTAAQNAVQELNAQDAVTIQLVCQSEDVYQIFYSTYRRERRTAREAGRIWTAKPSPLRRP